jgi:hypothetical protein
LLAAEINMESVTSANGEDALPNIPNMILAQWKFRLQHPPKQFSDAEATQIKSKLMDEVCKENCSLVYSVHTYRSF